MQTNRWTDRHINRHIDGQTGYCITARELQVAGMTDRQTDRQTDRRTDGRTDRQAAAPIR